MKLKLGKNLLKKSAGEVKALLEKRYKDNKDVSKDDIQKAIDHYYPKEEEEKKAKLNGDTSATEPKPSAPKKQG